MRSFLTLPMCTQALDEDFLSFPFLVPVKRKVWGSPVQYEASDAHRSIRAVNVQGALRRFKLVGTELAALPCRSRMRVVWKTPSVRTSLTLVFRHRVAKEMSTSDGMLECSL